jgi:hypothetical protein
VLLEVKCKFHYFLFAGTADFFHQGATLVVSGAHVVEFLLQLAILELVHLFFAGELLLLLDHFFA